MACPPAGDTLRNLTCRQQTAEQPHGDQRPGDPLPRTLANRAGPSARDGGRGPSPASCTCVLVRTLQCAGRRCLPCSCRLRQVPTPARDGPGADAPCARSRDESRTAGPTVRWSPPCAPPTVRSDRTRVSGLAGPRHQEGSRRGPVPQVGDGGWQEQRCLPGPHSHRREADRDTRPARVRALPR